MKTEEELCLLSTDELSNYIEDNHNDLLALEECLEAIQSKFKFKLEKDERRNLLKLSRNTQTLIWNFSARKRIEERHKADENINLIEQLKKDSIKELEQNTFTYADGSKDTTSYEAHLAEQATDYVFRNREAGKIYVENGIKFLCIHPWTSYGGGAATLWAFEGFSAQLTLYSQETGYIRGKCLEISENPLGIVFQAWVWPFKSDSDETGGSEPRFIEFSDIKRYDRNWW